MAFYISDISGTQTPYLEEIWRQQVLEQRTAQLSSEEVEGQVQTTDTESFSASTSNATEQSRPLNSVQTNAAVIGTAGASVMYRGREATDSTHASTPRELQQNYRKKAAYQQVEKVSQVKKSPQSGSEHAEIEQDQSSPTQRNFNPYEHSKTLPPARKPAVLAEQIMSSPVLTLPKHASLSEAQELFLKKRFRHVPVVSENGKLIGILSDRDFIGDLSIKSEVSEIMRTNILTARPDAEIRMIAQIFFKERIGSMPIVDKDGNLVGMITRSDILFAVVNHAPLELWV
ncbi:MAG: CBS domain-containing protein [Deltaproteobacteria bacterium]|nr:CBS domain-containing protein [Deltaproteobacteria bacterium]